MGSYDLQPLQSFTETWVSDSFLSCFLSSCSARGKFPLQQSPQPHRSTNRAGGNQRHVAHVQQPQRVESLPLGKNAARQPQQHNNTIHSLISKECSEIYNPPWKMDYYTLYSRKLEAVIGFKEETCLIINAKFAAVLIKGL